MPLRRMAALALLGYPLLVLLLWVLAEGIGISAADSALAEWFTYTVVLPLMVPVGLIAGLLDFMGVSNSYLAHTIGLLFFPAGSMAALARGCPHLFPQERVG